jgi:hypothetical protein
MDFYLSTIFLFNKKATMKQLKLFSWILAAAFLGSCSGSNPSENAPIKDSSVASINSQGSASTAKASFSCLIDGAQITGSGVDQLQLRNTAFVYPDVNNGHRLLFTLYSIKTSEDTKPDFALAIRCPDSVAEYQKSGLQDHRNKCYLMLDLLSGDFSRYYEDSIIINLISSTSSRISGTFSGSLALSQDTPRGLKKRVVITEGKFDIPFSTGNLRPE